MELKSIGPLQLCAEIEEWPLTTPFRITGYTFEVIKVLLVRLERDGHVGRGEAVGVYYKGDTAASMIKQIEPHGAAIEAGISSDSLQRMLPPGGARNALDCALWDLHAKLTGCPVWQLAGLDAPRPVLTALTCGADTPEKMVSAARAYAHARAIKLKLTGEPLDADRVRAVREALPDVWLSIDANQGFTRTFLERLMPILAETHVSLIEQPFPVGQEALLDGFTSPIPIAADESLQCLSDISGLPGRFDVVNIKLDKCGGFTEAMAIARAARSLGLGTMVGNMIGTSLAMAPAFIVAQSCNVPVDLDGPLFLRSDRSITAEYNDGFITCPEKLWGHS